MINKHADRLREFANYAELKDGELRVVEDAASEIERLQDEVDVARGILFEVNRKLDLISGNVGKVIQQTSKRSGI